MRILRKPLNYSTRVGRNTLSGKNTSAKIIGGRGRRIKINR
jgi:hypothetical protein